MKCKVLKPFDEHTVGDLIEMNDRRYKSEFRRGNVKEYKPVKKTKEKKFKRKTK